MLPTRTPLALAVAAALSLPIANAANSADNPQKLDAKQAESSQSEGSGKATRKAKEQRTLPTVKVEAQNLKEDYNPAISSIGGKNPTAIQDIPQTVTVINQAVMKAQAATTLKDVLRNVPGITMSAGEGGQIGDNINIRGYNARTDIFLDGFRDRGQYSRETFFLDAVEVLKGPSSMLFGRGSTGGVINQVSKKSQLEASKEINLAVGTDNYQRLTADINQPISASAALRVSVLAHEEDSSRDVAQNKRYGIAPTIGFGLGTDTQVHLSGILQRNDDIPDYGLPFTPNGSKANPSRPVDVPNENFYGFSNDFFEQDIKTLNLNISHKISDALTLRNQTQFQEVQTKAAPTVFSGVTSTTVNRARREREQNDSSLFNQTDLIIKAVTGSVAHEITTGVEIGVDEYERIGYNWTGLPSQTLLNPTYGPTPSTATRSLSASRAENEADTLAFYINETAKLNAHWQAVLGVRWDRFEVTSKSIDNTSGVVTPLSRDDDMPSVRAGIIYQPKRSHSYYFSYGTSFNPSGEALTLSSSATSFSNANLEPEENRSLELGAKWDALDSTLALSSAIFHVEKDNARTIDPLTNTVTLSGTTRVQGVELGASGQLSKNWQLFAGYTYLDGEIVELRDTSSDLSGNALPNTPEHSASLWTAYGISDAWKVGGGVVYTGERYLNNSNTSMVDGYTRFDASLSFVQTQYQVQLNLLNLTDEEYFDVASASRATPAKARSAVLTVSYQF